MSTIIETLGLDSELLDESYVGRLRNAAIKNIQLFERNRHPNKQLPLDPDTLAVFIQDEDPATCLASYMRGFFDRGYAVQTTNLANYTSARNFGFVRNILKTTELVATELIAEGWCVLATAEDRAWHVVPGEHERAADLDHMSRLSTVALHAVHYMPTI